MVYRRLVIAIFVAPLACVLVSKKLYNWIVGINELANGGPAISKFLILAFIGIVIFLVLRMVNQWSIVMCSVSGVVAVFLVDLIEIVDVIGKFYIVSDGINLPTQASLLSELAGGLVFGFCFWLIDPFRDVPSRKKISHDRNYDVYGDF
jgi:hypothetical protein